MYRNFNLDISNENVSLLNLFCCTIILYSCN